MQPCAAAPVAPIDGQHVELADIKSQYHAKRALEIAASGGHNLLILCPLLRIRRRRIMEDFLIDSQ